ncbi:uncharacterized protein METZ01_LOCUS139721 [marine metagenome]|uniref:Uncharacterized protein n=1 Tax=marine metagenome TaxID=408172 RepID=A0A381ZDM0_9ZZZZ
MSYTDLLVKIINIQKSKPLKFSLIMKEKQYKLNDVIMSKKNTVVSKKTVRGGAYISDKFVYQLKATVFEPGIATMLSGTMLGPNFDFDVLEIRVENMGNDYGKISLLTNLVNTLQKQSMTELTMNIIDIKQLTNF